MIDKKKIEELKTNYKATYQLYPYSTADSLNAIFEQFFSKYPSSVIEDITFSEPYGERPNNYGTVHIKHKTELKIETAKKETAQEILDEVERAINYTLLDMEEVKHSQAGNSLIKAIEQFRQKYIGEKGLM